VTLPLSCFQYRLLSSGGREESLPAGKSTKFEWIRFILNYFSALLLLLSLLALFGFYSGFFCNNALFAAAKERLFSGLVAVAYFVVPPPTLTGCWPEGKIEEYHS